MTERRSLAQLAGERQFRRAAEILLEECAPELSALVFNDRLPDGPLYTILEWSDRMQSAEPWTAFEIDDLPVLFRSLNVALVCSYTYARAEEKGNPPPPGKVHLRFTDTGGALLVERTRAAARHVAVCLNGAEAAAIVSAADAELRGMFDAISETIARAR